MKPENDLGAAMLKKSPLLTFSLYTHLQQDFIGEIGREIIGHLNGDSASEGKTFTRVYGLFWLWVLGAYEIVRTMLEAQGVKNCFSPTLVAELRALKPKLTRLRIPFAKQEIVSKRPKPVQAEPSIAGFSGSPPDIRFLVKGNDISVRATIDDFSRVFSKIKRSDVLLDHRETYPRSRNRR